MDEGRYEGANLQHIAGYLRPARPHLALPTIDGSEAKSNDAEAPGGTEIATPMRGGRRPRCVSDYGHFGMVRKTGAACLITGTVSPLAQVPLPAN